MHLGRHFLGQCKGREKKACEPINKDFLEQGDTREAEVKRAMLMPSIELLDIGGL